jgi:predicted O-methyltransferase YrrM
LIDARTKARIWRMFSPTWVVKRVVATAQALRNPDAPWMVASALAHVERWLRREHLVFEWGTGLSTPWLAKRAGKVIAIEHDPLWQRKTVQSLQEKSLEANVEVRLAKEEDYVAQIDAFADNSIDLILVDGLHAGAALAASMHKLKHGGMLVVNAAHLVLPSDSTTPDARSREDGPDENLDPAELIELMRWRLKWESDGVNDTAVFWKP